MKKVLMVRSNSQPTRILKEAQSLSQKGYDVTILYWDRDSNKSRVEVDNGIDINYFGLKSPYGKLTLLPFLLVWWIYEIYYMIKHDFDIVHACCFDTLVPVIITKQLKKFKIVYDLFDFYSESFPPSIPNILKTLASILEKYLIKFVDYIIIVDESRFIQIEGIPENKVEVIMNCPLDKSFEFNFSNKDKDFTIFYGGTITKTRGFQQLIDAIKDESDINLIIAGTGPDLSLFRQQFHQIDNIKYLGWIDYNKYIQLTIECDVTFAFYDPIIPNNRLASSNKLFESMMCKKPIIVNEETSMSHLVKKEKCGLIVPYGDTKALKESILKLKNNPTLKLELGENGRNAYIKQYNWNIMEEKLVCLYSNLA